MASSRSERLKKQNDLEDMPKAKLNAENFKKGARLFVPFSSIVEIQPIGLGITEPVINL